MESCLRKLAITLTAVSLVAILSVLLSAQQTLPIGIAARATLVLRGGKVITVDSSGTIASAVAITGNRIAAVGSDESIQQFIGAETRVIELQGRTVTPGFIDGHSHVEGMAQSENFLVPIHIPHSVASTAEIV